MHHKNLRTTLILLPAFAVLALLAVPELGVLAYTTTGTVAVGENLDYYVNPNFTDPQAGSAATQIAAMQAAADEWLYTGQSQFNFNYMGTSTTATVAYDQKNVVFYNPVDGNGSLAVAYWWTLGGQHDNFDIEFYSTDGAFDFAWSVSPVGGSEFDIQSVATHEFGHALGLGHSTVSGAVMWPSVAPADLSNRTLSADDIAGLVSLYGAGTPPPPAISFTSPNSAWIDGGMTVQIHGTGFPTSGVTVTIGGVPATNVVPVSTSRIDVTLPSASFPGAVDVVVDTGTQSDTLLGGFTYLSCRLQAPLAGGVSNVIQCRSPGDANYWYQGIVSEGNAGIDLSLATPGDNRIIPISYDWTAYYSQLDGVLADWPYFNKMNGFWDATGNATFEFWLPNIPELSGLGFYFCVLTGDPASPSFIRTISNAAHGVFP